MAILADLVSSSGQYATSNNVYESSKDAQHIRLPQDPLQPSKPACSVWPDWRESIPAGVPANDAALSTPRLGTAEVMGGLTGHGCVPADERLGPFGHTAAGVATEEDRPWSSLRWGDMQRDCAKAHFAESETTVNRKLRRVSSNIESDLHDAKWDARHTGRIAVVLRTWDMYHYYRNQMAWIRAMITELSLDTGGKFQLFILVDVKNQSLDLFNEETYAAVLERSVPKELRDMALLWNRALLREWFPKVGEHSAQDQMYQALQVFSFSFPEFDYIWQLEMDARFTGNIATMLTNAGLWAQNQPRKNLWERNSRWFVPGLWSNYSAFSAVVDEKFSHGQGIWGPHRYAEFYVKPQGPTPPDKSQQTWGVGEPADLINFSPLIDPINTEWTYEHAVHGFQPAWNLPRRMSIISMTRTSRRLLRLISQEQRATGSWVVSESTPETWALLHGLKAVYAPHLLAFNFKEGYKSPEELDKMIHKGPPWSLAGGERTGFLWCGNEIKLPEPRWREASYFFWEGDAPRTWWVYTNGTCTWPLLLHPVKHD